MTKTIPLTKGRVALVSDEDYEYLVSLGSWCFSNAAYAVHFHRTEEGCRQTWSMHRVIYARILGHAIPPGLTVDHIDNNRLNNTRPNLRLANATQQQSNRKFKNLPSGFKGVTEEPNGKFRARIRYDYSKSLHLGIFNDPAFAAMLYDAAAHLFHGEFASPNSDTPPSPEALAILRERIQSNPEAVAFLNRVGRLKDIC